MRRSMGVIAAALALVGCGAGSEADRDAGNGSTQAAAPEPDQLTAAQKRTNVCELITTEEASAALGGPVKLDSNDPGAGSPVTSCGWFLDTEDVFKMANRLQVSVTDQSLDQIMPPAQRAELKAEEIADLGTPALYSTAGLQVARGERTLTYLLSGDEYDADRKARLIAVARASMGRL